METTEGPRAAGQHGPDILNRTPAPGRLELVRAFLSLHDHAPGDDTSLPPSTGTIAAWLREARLADPTEKDVTDLAWASTILEALHARVEEHTGAATTPGTTERLNAAAAETGLRPRFDSEDEPIHTDADGVRGAIGRLLGIAFLAQLDGTWERLRVCSSPTCTSVFFDSSKNRSGRWCDMRACGNQAKVRAYRARQRAAAT